jgi:UDP-N-acetylglucosamine diphosphorylase/glucosamine-1-phosphate N-acetyltransferase
LDLHILILAAGKGTRMKSARAKVLHHVAGRPMIEHVVATASALAPRSITTVVGHQADEVMRTLEALRLTFVVQQPQLGTGHALLSAEAALAHASGTLVLLSGDVPLLSGETLKTLVNRHVSTAAAATVVTAIVDDPAGYGRIIRSGEQIARIVEEKDATSAQLEVREINSGIYAFRLEGLFDAVRSVAAENAQREYYLPDLVDIFRRQGARVETITVPDPDEIRGINSRADLAAVSRTVRANKPASRLTIRPPRTSIAT